MRRTCIYPLITIYLLLFPMSQVYAIQYVPYQPNPEPVLGNPIMVQEPKSVHSIMIDSGSVEKEWWEEISWGNVSIYTQGLWNFIGDLSPMILAVKYAQYCGFYVQEVVNPYGGRTKFQVYGLYPGQQPPFLKSWDSKIGNLQIRLGNQTFPFGQRLMSRLQDLNRFLIKKGRLGLNLPNNRKYGPEKKQIQRYLEQIGRYDPKSPYAYSLGDAIQSEVKKTFRETLLFFSRDSRSVSWSKMTGYVGLGASIIFTTLDYTIGEQKKKGVQSSEFVAALVVDFAVGALVAIVGTAIGAMVVSFSSIAFGITFPIFAVTLVVILTTFTIGFIIENFGPLKDLKKKIHGFVSDLISSGSQFVRRLYKRVTSYRTS